MKKVSLKGRAYPTDLNHHGNVFGGWLMAKMDKAAGIAVDEIVYTPAVTVAVSDIQFIRPVHNGDVFVVYTEIVYIGNTSIKIRTDVKVISYLSNHEYDVTTAEFVFVCTDRNGKKVSVCDVLRPNVEPYIHELVKTTNKAEKSENT